jgi:thiol-disulfide isomerase/thioredoxin
MLKSIFSLAFLSLSIIAVSQTKDINFEHGTFAEIKAKAKKENKLIFVDAYTTWCGPCKQMAKTVFTNDAVADFYNFSFINAKIDMEKGEGIEIAKQYEVKCYPNLLFIDGDGNLVHRIAGFMSAKEFISLGKETQYPEKCFSYYTKNFDANKTNADFLAKYIVARESTCLESQDIVKDYFAQQKEENLTSKANWDMIVYHINDMDSKVFDFVIANKQKYIDLYTEKAVNGKIDGVSESTLSSIIRMKTFDAKKYNDAKTKIESLKTPNTKLIFIEADMKLSQHNGNWMDYAKLAMAHVDNYYLKDANMLNSIAWNFYEKVEDKEALIKAEGWAGKACELDKNYANLDTYAAVLYKVGKKDLALQTANKAIDVAKKEKYAEENYKGTIELIEKIKAVK